MKKTVVLVGFLALLSSMPSLVGMRLGPKKDIPKKSAQEVTKAQEPRTREMKPEDIPKDKRDIAQDGKETTDTNIITQSDNFWH